MYHTDNICLLATNFQDPDRRFQSSYKVWSNFVWT